MVLISNLFITSVLPEYFAFASCMLESMFFVCVYVIKEKCLYVYKFSFFKMLLFGREEDNFKNEAMKTIQKHNFLSWYLSFSFYS